MPFSSRKDKKNQYNLNIKKDQEQKKFKEIKIKRLQEIVHK